MSDSATSGLLGRRFNNLRRIDPRSDRQDVLNVFTPHSKITLPAKFGGRETQVEQMLDALLAEGADMVVFGERGSGKSSLANMLHHIAQGDFELLDYYGLRERLERRGFLSWLVGPSRKQFNTIWVDGFNRTLDEVIHSILTRRREQSYGPGLLSYLPREADQVEVASSIGFNKVFTAEGSTKEVTIREKPINIKEGFELAVQRYADSNESDLVIIIDEFDTVRDRQEISQYLKTVQRVKFVVVGIADTITELIGQHASVARDTHAIELPPMTEDELRTILMIGSYILSSYCTYSDNAIDEIVTICNGSPYWCQFLAKGVLQEYVDVRGGVERFLQRRERKIFEKIDVRSLVKNLPNKPECVSYEETLKTVTFGDETTKKVLLATADEFLRKAKLPRDYRNPLTSTFMADLLVSRFGISRTVTLETLGDLLRNPSSPFEEKGRIRDILSFAFRDPDFERYLVMRLQPQITEIDYSGEMTPISASNQGNSMDPIIAAIEYQIMRTVGRYVRISSSYLHYYLQEGRRPPSWMQGVLSGDSQQLIDVLKNRGVIEASVWDGPLGETPSNEVEQAFHYRMQNCRQVDGLSGIKRGLLSVGPILAGLSLFESMAVDGRWSTEISAIPTGSVQGTLRICIVSYNDVLGRLGFISPWSESRGFVSYKVIEKCIIEPWVISL